MPPTSRPLIVVVLLALLLPALTLAAGGSASAAVSAGGEQVGASSAQHTYAQAARKATNKQRDHHGLRPLKKNACVQKWANRQSAAQARRGEMFHQDLSRVARDCGLTSVGENVAYGYPGGKAVVRGWMNSPGHRANILNRGFRLLGMSARKSESGLWYATQVFGRR